MKTILLAVAVLLASSAFAQSKPIKVQVVPEDNPESRPIGDGMAGQIGSSSRYALVTKDADLLLFVSCLQIGRQRQISVCDVSLEYWPVAAVGLYVNLESELVLGSESQVIQQSFNSFVKETSDEALKAASNDFKRALNLAVLAHPNGVK